MGWKAFVPSADTTTRPCSARAAAAGRGEAAVRHRSMPSAVYGPAGSAAAPPAGQSRSRWLTVSGAPQWGQVPGHGDPCRAARSNVRVVPPTMWAKTRASSAVAVRDGAGGSQVDGQGVRASAGGVAGVDPCPQAGVAEEAEAAAGGRRRPAPEDGPARAVAPQFAPPELDAEPLETGA